MTRRTQEAAMQALKTTISSAAVALFTVGGIVATAATPGSPLHALMR